MVNRTLRIFGRLGQRVGSDGREENVVILADGAQLLFLLGLPLLDRCCVKWVALPCGVFCNLLNNGLRAGLQIQDVRVNLLVRLSHCDLSAVAT